MHTHAPKASYETSVAVIYSGMSKQEFSWFLPSESIILARAIIEFVNIYYRRTVTTVVHAPIPNRYPEVAASCARPGLHDGLQALLACKMLKGPTVKTARCTDEVDKDEHGRTILTRESPREQWLCARFEDQLKIEYLVDVRLVMNAETATDEQEGKLPWLHGEVRRELRQLFPGEKKCKRPPARMSWEGVEVQASPASAVVLGTKRRNPSAS